MYEGPYTSAAHGWSTGVLPALTNDLLGAAPTGPGFATWSVRPHPGSVTWARGQLPTPHGPLRVGWTAGTGRHTFTLTVDAPPGTSGTVSVPTNGDPVRVLLDGRPLRGHEDGSYVTVTGVSGHHTLTVVPIGG
jgi:hypothetical protein